MARYAERYRNHRELMTVGVANQMASALGVDLGTVTAAERLRTEYWHRVRRLLERFDYIVTPTVGVPAFRLDGPLPDTVGGRRVASFYDAILTTYAFSLVGLPALSVPCGFTAAGLPVGLQIVGPRQREDRVLALGAAYLARFPGHLRRCVDVDASALSPVSDSFSLPGVPVAR